MAATPISLGYIMAPRILSHLLGVETAIYFHEMVYMTPLCIKFDPPTKDGYDG